MALVSPLLRLENNHCHIEESEYVLKKAHKYSELIILYEKKGLHRKGKGLGPQRRTASLWWAVKPIAVATRQQPGHICCKFPLWC